MGVDVCVVLAESCMSTFVVLSHSTCLHGFCEDYRKRYCHGSHVVAEESGRDAIRSGGRADLDYLGCCRGELDTVDAVVTVAGLDTL